LLLPDYAPVLVPVASVKLYIDPLDATDEFTKGNYEAVLMLIGIVVDAKPYAGVCNLDLFSFHFFFSFFFFSSSSFFF
jgi:hypothetical protein